MSDPINDLWVNSIVKIENEEGIIGTGFLIKKNEKKILITNKHVLHKSKFKRDSANFVYLHLNILDNNRLVGKKIQFMLRDNDRKLWNEHPDIQIDVLGMDVTEICQSVTNIVTKPVEISLVCNSSLLKEYHITSGRKVIVLGYPHTVEHTENNLPMTISGSIMSRIGETITHAWDNPITAQIERVQIKGFAIEANVVLGSSGSPVILEPVMNVYGGEEHTIGKLYPAFLLGIISEEKITYLDVGRYQPSPSGTIIVFDAETIIDVINLFQ